MRWKNFAFCCLSVAAISANAQVHRCTDATGKLSFSDQPCAPGQAGNLIERERSQAEINREREQASNAEARKQERRWAEQARETGADPRGNPRPVVPTPTQATEGWQARKDRENAATSARSITRDGGRFDRSAEETRAKERALQHGPRYTAHITSCAGDFCQDEHGNTYSFSGSTLVRTDGAICHRSGPVVDCN